MKSAQEAVKSLHCFSAYMMGVCQVHRGKVSFTDICNPEVSPMFAIYIPAASSTIITDGENWYVGTRISVVGRVVDPTISPLRHDVPHVRGVITSLIQWYLKGKANCVEFTGRRLKMYKDEKYQNNLEAIQMDGALEEGI